jgi:hypothetical protein
VPSEEKERCGCGGGCGCGCGCGCWAGVNGWAGDWLSGTTRSSLARRSRARMAHTLRGDSVAPGCARGSVSIGLAAGALDAQGLGHSLRLPAGRSGSERLACREFERALQPGGMGRLLWGSSSPRPGAPGAHDRTRTRWLRAVFLGPLLVSALACRYPGLGPNAHAVDVTTLPPPASCTRVADIRGRAGTTWPPAELFPEPPIEPQNSNDLLRYAMNDLRNRAADLGANYVQRSAPTLSAPWGRTTHAAYAGVAYRCVDR